MTTTTQTFTEGDELFITTKNAKGDERILFAATLEAILPTDNGDLLVAGGLSFHADDDGQYVTTSGDRDLFLHQKSGGRIAQMRAQGLAAREARQAEDRRLLDIENAISAAHQAQRRAHDAVMAVQHSKPRRIADLHRAKAQVALCQARVDSFDSDLKKAEDAAGAASVALDEALAARD